MEREIIILTKSEKINNYCVAGIDIQTGKWVRLVSEDESIKYALTSKDIEYDENKEVNVLDKVKVEIKENQNCWYHPENYIVDSDFYFGHPQKVSKKDIEQYVEYKDIIFFNQENSIEEDELEEVKKIYSLIMIEPKVFKVRIHQNQNKKRLKASILYNEIWYNNIIITDTEFINKYYDEVMNSQNGSINFRNVKVILSLAEKNPKDGKYYKLVASVIE